MDRKGTHVRPNLPHGLCKKAGRTPEARRVIRYGDIIIHGFRNPHYKNPAVFTDMADFSTGIHGAVASV